MSSSARFVNGKEVAGPNNKNVQQAELITQRENVSSQTQQTPCISIKPNPSPTSSETEVPPQTAHLHASRDTKLRSRGQTASPYRNQPVLVREYSGNTPNMKRSPFARTGQLRSQSSQEVSNNPPPTSAFSFEDILAAIQPEVQSSIDAIAEACGRNKLSLANEYDSHLPPHGALDLSSVLGEHVNSPSTPTVSRLEPVEESSSIAEGSATVNNESGQVDRQAYRRHSRSWSLLAASNIDGKRYTAATSDVQTMTRKATPTAQVTSLDLRQFPEQTHLNTQTVPAFNPQSGQKISIFAGAVEDDSFRNANRRSNAASTLNKVLRNTSSMADA